MAETFCNLSFQCNYSPKWKLLKKKNLFKQCWAHWRNFMDLFDGGMTWSCLSGCMGLDQHCFGCKHSFCIHVLGRASEVKLLLIGRWDSHRAQADEQSRCCLPEADGGLWSQTAAVAWLLLIHVWDWFWKERSRMTGEIWQHKYI